MRVISILFALLFTIASAQAHGVKLFAYQEADDIVGQAYFTGGGPAINCQLVLQDETQKAVLQAHTDDVGKFRLPLPSGLAGKYTLILDAGPGHRAMIDLQLNILQSSSNIGEHAPLISENSLQLTEAPKPELSDLPVNKDHPAYSINATHQKLLDLESRIVDLSRQVNALNAVCQQDVGIALEKIISGLGYILGLLGLATYMRCRAQAKSRD